MAILPLRRSNSTPSASFETPESKPYSRTATVNGGDVSVALGKATRSRSMPILSELSKASSSNGKHKNNNDHYHLPNRSEPVTITCPDDASDTASEVHAIDLSSSGDDTSINGSTEKIIALLDRARALNLHLCSDKYSKYYSKCIEYVHKIAKKILSDYSLCDEVSLFKLYEELDFLYLNTFLIKNDPSESEKKAQDTADAQIASAINCCKAVIKIYGMHEIVVLLNRGCSLALSIYSDEDFKSECEGALDAFKAAEAIALGNTPCDVASLIVICKYLNKLILCEYQHDPDRSKSDKESEEYASNLFERAAGRCKVMLNIYGMEKIVKLLDEACLLISPIDSEEWVGTWIAYACDVAKKIRSNDLSYNVNHLTEIYDNLDGARSEKNPSNVNSLLDHVSNLCGVMRKVIDSNFNFDNYDVDIGDTTDIKESDCESTADTEESDCEFTADVLVGAANLSPQPLGDESAANAEDDESEALRHRSVPVTVLEDSRAIDYLDDDTFNCSDIDMDDHKIMKDVDYLGIDPITVNNAMKMCVAHLKNASRIAGNSTPQNSMWYHSLRTESTLQNDLVTLIDKAENIVKSKQNDVCCIKSFLNELKNLYNYVCCIKTIEYSGPFESTKRYIQYVLLNVSKLTAKMSAVGVSDDGSKSVPVEVVNSDGADTAAKKKVEKTAADDSLGIDPMGVSSIRRCVTHLKKALDYIVDNGFQCQDDGLWDSPPPGYDFAIPLSSVISTLISDAIYIKQDHFDYNMRFYKRLFECFYRARNTIIINANPKASAALAIQTSEAVRHFVIAAFFLKLQAPYYATLSM